MPPHQPITWVEISRSAIFHNIRALRQAVPRGVIVMPVIKSNAYGHGFLEIASLCAAAKSQWIGVVNADEALTLHHQYPKAKILILSFYNPRILTELIRRKIRMTVYGLSAAKKINTIAQRLHTKAYLHLKVDTGTSRLGLQPTQAISLAQDIHALTHVVLEGIFTHFADAENPNQKVTRLQLAKFKSVITALAQEHIEVPVKHTACSAAIILNPDTHFDLVRAGIALYGLNSIESHRITIPLKPALSWHTRILQVKTLPAGSRIGYGQTYRATRSIKLAILPIGYWDGYDRRFSNRGQVIIGGKKCHVRGRICMNLTMVDVTGVPRVKAGDRATLIGYTKKAQITADDLAQTAGTINYEIVTRINPLIPRIIVA